MVKVQTDELASVSPTTAAAVVTAAAAAVEVDVKVVESVVSDNIEPVIVAWERLSICQLMLIRITYSWRNCHGSSDCGRSGA